MNKWTYAALAAVGMVLNAARADEVVHQVNFPTGDTTWSVDFQAGGTSNASPPAGAAPAKKMREIEIVRQGHMRRDTITFSDGTTQERWWVQNPDYALFQNGSVVSSMRAAEFAPVRFDASSFDFITAQYYKGKQSQQGIDCQYYEYRMEDNLQGWGFHGRIVRAWIDPKTHLPVAYDNGGGIGVFTFSKGPVPDLKMPPNFEKKYQQLLAFFAPPKPSH